MQNVSLIFQQKLLMSISHYCMSQEHIFLFAFSLCHRHLQKKKSESKILLVQIYRDIHLHADIISLS